MNKYKLKMRTLTGLGNEYVYVYATSNFERYLNKHNLKYARDITKDYQLTDRFAKIQSQLEQKEDNWNKLKEWLEEEYKRCDKIGNPAIGCAMGQIKRIKSKMQEIEGGMNE